MSLERQISIYLLKQLLFLLSWYFFFLLIRNMPLLGGKKGGSDKTVEMESGAALGYDFWRLSGVRTVL